MFKRYVKSKRHTMQVDFDDYLRARARAQARAPSAPASAASALPRARAGPASRVAA